MSQKSALREGLELFRIADLSRSGSWLTHLKMSPPFSAGSMSTSDIRERCFMHRWVPRFPSLTRQPTLKVRLETDNPATSSGGHVVDVELPSPPRRRRRSAAASSGDAEDRLRCPREGLFEPRQVETGWRFGDRVEIRKGLDPGSGSSFRELPDRFGKQDGTCRNRPVWHSRPRPCLRGGCCGEKRRKPQSESL